MQYARIIGFGGAAMLAGITALSAPAYAGVAGKTLTVKDKGTISAGGAAVKVPFTAQCPEGWSGYLNLNVVEAIGDSFAAGYGGKTLKCTGKVEKGFVYLQAQVSENTRPFRPGQASMLATMDAYEPSPTCGEGAPCPVDDMSAKPAATPVHKESSGTIMLVNKG